MINSTEKLTKEIIEKTMEITKIFPELAKYISEMPINSLINKDEEIQDSSLNDYLDSLNHLMKRYELSHNRKT